MTHCPFTKIHVLPWFLPYNVNGNEFIAYNNPKQAPSYEFNDEMRKTFIKTHNELWMSKMGNINENHIEFLPVI